MPAAATKIWLPGSGLSDIRMAYLDSAVQEYDPNLRFGRNEDTGDYCVFVIKRGMDPLPVLGFRDIPERETVFRRLYETDTVRHGKEILNRMNRENEEIWAEDERAADEGAGQTAEAFDWAYRQMGRAPYSKVMLNGNGRKMGGWS